MIDLILFYAALAVLVIWAIILIDETLVDCRISKSFFRLCRAVCSLFND